MNLLGIRKKSCSRFWALKSEQGFSLLELLMALLILMVIVIAFTPLLLNSIERITYAGDKSEAIYMGQSDLEVAISERITVDGHELVFTFDTTEISVPGGLVEAKTTEGRAEAWLSGFVPFVPSISLYLNPLPLVEGYNATEIIIMGHNTNFNLALTQDRRIEFYDKKGLAVPVNSYDFGIRSLASLPEDVPDNFDEYASFRLSPGLTNSNSIYRVELSWEIENDIMVTVRSRLQVVLPYAVTVGDPPGMWISPDAEKTWRGKSQAGLTLGRLNDIVWTGFEFLAVDAGGRVVSWRDEKDIVASGLASAITSLNAVCSSVDAYIVVGDTGLIWRSTNAVNWMEVHNQGNDNLNAVAWSDDETRFVAVGDRGTLLTSIDGTTWEDYSDDSLPNTIPSATLTGVAYGKNFWVVVGTVAGAGGSGKNAVILRRSASTDADPWEEMIINETLPGLNDVLFDGTRFIAVGDSGTVITSLDGEVWTLIEDLGTGVDLNAVAWGAIVDNRDNYIIVGDSGTVLTWTGVQGVPWVLQPSVTSGNLHGVAVRWKE
ncbi:MAG TPA: prepilin-type N-terminal cleavage/methylation domain-containing protein [Candidatus Limnocylindrales bacterium]|nr:prepilin-type N-terminal cleavage/methylation domain-containing protein [Candidatus Limnocylindrales bacterium]